MKDKKNKAALEEYEQAVMSAYALRNVKVDLAEREKQEAIKQAKQNYKDRMGKDETG